MFIHKRDGKESKNHTRIVTREEEAKIVTLLQDAASDNRRRQYSDVADIIVVLADTGMRLGEALDFQYADIDAENNLLKVHSRKSNRCRRI